MSGSLTNIRAIIGDVQCKNLPLDKDYLSGKTLLDEVIKVAVMTVGFNFAWSYGALYIASYAEVLTKAYLKTLMEFAREDHTNKHVAAFYKEVLSDYTNERDLALQTISIYMNAYPELQRLTNWSIPEVGAVLMAIRQASGDRPVMASKVMQEESAEL